MIRFRHIILPTLFMPRRLAIALVTLASSFWGGVSVTPPWEEEHFEIRFRHVYVYINVRHPR